MAARAPVGRAVLPLDPVAPRPEPRTLSSRQRQVVELGIELLASDGRESLTMRRLAGALDLRAPSLYKHVASKAELEVFIVENAMFELGVACHAAVSSDAGARDPVGALLATYRRLTLAQPELYRLATGRSFPRAGLLPGLEAWSGEPFWRAVGDANRAQALWAFAHGMADLEIDDRLMPADLDATWAAGAAAFSRGSAGSPRAC